MKSKSAIITVYAEEQEPQTFILYPDAPLIVKEDIKITKIELAKNIGGKS